MPTLRCLLVITALLLGLYGLVSIAQAQTTRPTDGQTPKNLQKLQDAVAGLDLTPEQKKQVQSLKDEIAEAARGLGPAAKDETPEQRRQAIRQSVGNVREKFEAILTPDQRKQLQENMDSRRIPGHKPLADLKADAKIDGDAMADSKAAEKKDDASPTTKPEAAKSTNFSDTPMVARLQQVLATLGLSDEQKTKTDAILADAHTQIAKLKQDANGDREAARPKAMQLMQSIRQQLAAVLTPDQQQKLKEAVPGRGGGLGGGGGGKRNADKGNGPSTQPTGTPINPTAAKVAAGSSTQPTRPANGTHIPAFTLTRISGSTLTSKMLAGEPTVLVFGSLTSPSFRDRVPQLQDLANRYHTIHLIVVYTREAHPSDGWQVDRNRDDKLEIKAPTTMAERTALAKRLHDLSRTTLDIAVDSFDDATSKAFGDAIEGAAVISPYGTIIGTQTYCDPSGLPRMIDLALKSKE